MAEAKRDHDDAPRRGAGGGEARGVGGGDGQKTRTISSSARRFAAPARRAAPARARRKRRGLENEAARANRAVSDAKEKQAATMFEFARKEKALRRLSVSASEETARARLHLCRRHALRAEIAELNEQTQLRAQLHAEALATAPSSATRRTERSNRRADELPRR